MTGAPAPQTGEPAGSRVSVAAFDFDGTLVPGDSLLPFLERVLGRAALRRQLVGGSPVVLRAFGLSRDRDAAKAALLARLLAGLDEEVVQTHGAAYAETLVRRVRPSLLDRIDWHRSQGHRIVMVSASLEVYLGAVGRHLGLDAVLATRLDVGADGRLTGRLAGANVRGAEKQVRLAAWLATAVPEGAELWAYGDSAGDRQLLAMADHPVWVSRRHRPGLAAGVTGPG